MKFLSFPATPFLSTAWPVVEGKSGFVTEDANQEEKGGREAKLNEATIVN